MTFYCYALYDYTNSEFSLIQSHVNDDVAVYEFVRQILASVTSHNLLDLTVESPVNPFVWIDNSFRLNDSFLKRFSIFRVGIFNTFTGLLDGSVERVDLADKLLEVLKSYLDYYNSLDYFKNPEVKDEI